jgi:hypothetical protein
MPLLVFKRLHHSNSEILYYLASIDERVTQRGLDVMSLFNIVHMLAVIFENLLRYGIVNT